jgi:hypothetical protein
MNNKIIFQQCFPSSIWKENDPKRGLMKLLFQLDVMEWKVYNKSFFREWKEIRKMRRGREISFATWNVQEFRGPDDLKINLLNLIHFISNTLAVDILCLQEYPIGNKNHSFFFLTVSFEN